MTYFVTQNDLKCHLTLRKKIVAAFVSRMDADTKPDDMIQHLASVGIPDVVCRKITPNNGKIFTTAAFFCFV